ncbi:ABC-2 transporter permease [Solibacillus sp. MA9]|uniref:ABC-2 transporter permease n=1 Tax=Solibacillus palustris TaxID=2908203 RepID=A0ABS9UCE5_9BACL|nr:ABC-2 transporter permease [Solibacillus sp. MA9]MCH7321979.1 ABC-2 transporter permease [Solibacillus sp. MA9]
MMSLVLKDLLNLQSYLKTIIVFVVFYSILSFSMDDVSFVAGMLIILFAMIPISSFTYDQQAKWDVFGHTLPVTRKQMVQSKYVVALLFIVMGLVISLIITVTVTFIKESSVEVVGLFASNSMVASVGLILLAVMLPLIYKFGVEKSRIMLLAISSMPIIALLLLSNLGVTIPSNIDWQKVTYIVPVIALIIFTISYYISHNIYDKKDF